MEEIKETTVGNLNGERVGVGNIWEDSYTLADGTSRTGLTAQLFIMSDDKDIIVGQDSVITVGETDWLVVAIEKPVDKLGKVILKPLTDN
ncbi:MAG: hypothetical protein H6631_00610 [Anaerolineaceae bacterium]|nr:hypothetical protein [Anaerolineaceae bacterium]MCB9100295.1 hypothetical protein [Anaerolineales bacterium]